MRPAARHRLTLVTLVVGEGYFYVRYAQSGAEFHFWLHALLGGALGLGVLTAARLVRPREVRPWRTHEAGMLGHLWSAVPDVLFLVSGALHVAWMDVFALHITAHFLWPGPLLAALVLWACGVGAWTAERLALPRVAVGVLLGAVAFLGLAVALRAPLPTTLQQVVDGGSDGGPDRAWSWVCGVDV
ncbi:MAG: hypothetical protein JWO60_3112 [Frankiales bacterium]|nr:hypothetical protein [Frankiales bacterium]